MRLFQTIPLEERYWEKVDRRDDDECWPWLGATDRKGTGKIYYHGKLVYAPRIAYFLEHGKHIDKELLACHTCGNQNCVNPNHIFAGTRQSAVQTTILRGSAPVWMYERRVCPHGHHYTDDNKRKWSTFTRCKICSKKYRHELYLRKKTKESPNKA